MYVHYLDPHPGYQPPDEEHRLFESNGYAGTQGATAEDLNRLEKAGLPLNEPDLRHLINLYDGEIRFTDEQMAALLEHIDHDGFCENCVVVVLADHGEEFQDHGHFFHGFTLYDEMIHVPLIVYTRGTWSFAPRAVPDLVEITDLSPALIEMAGGLVPDRIDGKSLLPLLRGAEGATHAAVDSELQPDPLVEGLMHPTRHRLAVRESNRKLLVERDGQEEFYRVDTDPGEQQNVAASEPAAVARLLALAGPRETFPATTIAEAPLTAGQREQMRALGYLP